MREFGEEKTGWKGEETTPSFVITVPAVSFFMRFSEREKSSFESAGRSNFCGFFVPVAVKHREEG